MDPADIERDDACRVDLAQEILGLEFTDKELLRTALTHPSHGSPEHDHDHYERFEFLGDAVLGFLMTDYLFRAYPDLPEGRLTKLRSRFVSSQALAAAAERVGIAEALIVGRGAEVMREQHARSLMADSFEAILAAIYLDQGLEAASAFLFRVLTPDLISETVDEAAEDDPKNTLQELTQASDGSLPEYRTTKIEGPPHDRTFTSEVRVGQRVLGSGVGASKKEAQRRAAEEALANLEGRPEGA